MDSAKEWFDSIRQVKKESWKDSFTEERFRDHIVGLIEGKRIEFNHHFKHYMEKFAELKETQFSHSILKFPKESPSALAFKAVCFQRVQLKEAELNEIKEKLNECFYLLKLLCEYCDVENPIPSFTLPSYRNV